MRQVLLLLHLRFLLVQIIQVTQTMQGLRGQTQVLAIVHLEQILDMSNVDGSDELRLVARFSAGVQTAFGGDVVYMQ